MRAMPVSWRRVRRRAGSGGYGIAVPSAAFPALLPRHAVSGHLGGIMEGSAFDLHAAACVLRHLRGGISLWQSLLVVVCSGKAGGCGHGVSGRAFGARRHSRRRFARLR